MGWFPFWQRRCVLEGIAYWPFCIAASRSSDYGFVVMPRPVLELGLEHGFRNRNFIINQQTKAVVHSVLKPKTNGRELEFVYRTEATLVEGKELVDYAQRKLFNTSGFMTQRRMESESLVQAIVDLAVIEVAPVLTAFLSAEDSSEYPVIAEQRHFDRTLRSIA